MKDLEIIDNYVDDREFRNYVSSLLEAKGFKRIVMDDTTLADEDSINDNDILAEKDGMKYTVQTFLNVDITEKEIEETLKDVDHENVGYGILVTNKEVSDNVKELAKEKGVEI